MRRFLIDWILTATAVAVTASLSVGAFQAEAANAGSTTTVPELAAAQSIDQEARAKYLIAQEEKKAKETAGRARVASTSSARSNAASRTTAQGSTQSCDRLIIPKIGLNSCLATVGLTSGGAVDVHASLPAWFNQSSRAGTQDGVYPATFIDGHRSGIFRNLGKLAVGDQVTIALAGGESYKYTVRATEITPLAQVNMHRALVVYGGVGQGLNLMTCDGAYNSSIGTAENRLIIYTTLV
ncbi:class F sortase [Candidatus Saccharibacteria bacterium]|nr:class F sortase [Candidatus Saccharibacteria bacterium]